MGRTLPTLAQLQGFALPWGDSVHLASIVVPGGSGAVQRGWEGRHAGASSEEREAGCQDTPWSPLHREAG